MTRKPVVLFVCNHNAGRSQMAEAYLRDLAPDRFEAISAGSNPAAQINPQVRQALAEDGIDLGDARPKRVDAAMLARADHVITMGCADGCLVRKDEDWSLPDPAGQPIERARTIREEVKAKVRDLIARLAGVPVEDRSAAT